MNLLLQSFRGQGTTRWEPNAEGSRAEGQGIQKSELEFKKNPTVGLPEVSRLIDSTKSRDKETKGNTVFLRKIYS